MRRKPLRVYGWQGYRIECPAAANGSHYTREICAAYSQAEVTRLAGVNRPSQLFNLCETGNAEERRLALAMPHSILWKPLDQIGGGFQLGAPKP